MPGRKVIEPDHAVTRERWPTWLKEMFNAAGPASVWIGGSLALISCTVHHPDGTVTRFGHNRLARPVKLGVSESWRDTVTQRLNQTPFWWQGLLVRLWVPSDMHARRLMAAAVDDLSADAELTHCERDFIDVGPDLSLDDIEGKVLRLALKMGIDAWDDEGLVKHLTALHAKTRAAEAKRKGLRS